MIFENVFVPDKNKLEYVKDFNSGIGKILESSRLGVAWMAAGVACGAYESALVQVLKQQNAQS